MISTTTFDISTPFHMQISMNAVKSLVTSMPPAVTRMVHMNAHVLKDTLAMGLCVKVNSTSLYVYAKLYDYTQVFDLLLLFQFTLQMLMNVVQFWVSVLRGVITL